MILFVTNVDTELLALRVAVESLPEGFGEVLGLRPGARALEAAAGAELVVVRLLGGTKSWADGLDQLLADAAARAVPVMALGAEAVADEDLLRRSSVPAGVWSEAQRYLAAGGPANLANLLRFLADTVLLGGFGFDPPMEVPMAGRVDLARLGVEAVVDESWPVAAIVFYRAHLVSGNVGFVAALARALVARCVRPVPIFCYSLREGAPGADEAGRLLGEARPDVVVATVWAAGQASGDGWDPSLLGRLGVPVVQAIASTSSVEDWSARAMGLSPVDVATSVAIPEFDGRIISVPFSFKEEVDDGWGADASVSAYRVDPERCGRVAGIVARLARLRQVPAGERRVAIVLSAYPTKADRLGNAVGLDTPASLVELLRALRADGVEVGPFPEDSDALMARVVAGLVYDRSRLSVAEAEAAVGRLSAEAYRKRFEALPVELQDAVSARFGPPPGSVHVDGDELVFAGLDLGHVLVAVQPPRGFDADPIALYHSPELPPTHHYLGFYWWLQDGFGADAIVHLGKHGTLEWLPGKAVGLSAACAPDAALGDVPLVYPFVVNDPGEGIQAKRRAHAVVVDHLVPPMTRAGSYGALARVEAALDAHAEVAAMDPAKLPLVRRDLVEALVAADLQRDLALRAGAAVPLDAASEAIDELVPEIDGYLCELKDAQIRGGLHVLGVAPAGEALVDLVLAIVSVRQGPVPSLRSTVASELGLPGSGWSRAEQERVEARCRELVGGLAEAGWRYDGEDPTLRFVCERLVPALGQTGDEVRAVLGALSGRFVSPGPAGAPTRGMAHVLPTGRNFYSLDPRSVPSPLAWEVGQELASGVLERARREQGDWPRHVAVVVWGTAQMRTSGDDVAEVLALLGVRPRWDPESGRVVGLDLIPVSDLGRPRVDVTVRISGFFRDAFPDVVRLLDEAALLAAAAEPESGDNAVRAGGEGPRVFGPKPGSYGSGILPVIETRSWRDDADLAQVYLTWSGFAYGRTGWGEPAGEALRTRLSAVDVAVKNQDNREHDIFDSDDYLQDHGGLVAAVRHLRGGSAPLAYFGDSADPERPRVRSLAEEAARVVRTRVLNPCWIEAMRRHGYKGAFEMAATVDYLFGYDATAGIVDDWMYEAVTNAYIADPDQRAFLHRSNPWALQAMAERLLEAAEREMWSASEAALDVLRSALLEAEGWEEGG